jgi:hypothetical protein
MANGNKFMPPSGREHPPAAGAHSCGPMMTNNGATTSDQADAVVRSQKTNPPPKK